MGDMVQLSGWFKTSYASKVTDLIPDVVFYAREAPAEVKASQPGGDYAHPVVLSSEQGITKAGAAAGSVALNSPRSMNVRQSTLAGSQLLLRTTFDYETITRLDSQNSFETETKPVIKNMLESAYQYLEYDIMYGRSGVGTVLSAVGAPLYTITDADFAPGFWWGSEGREVYIYSALGVYRGHAQITAYNIDAAATLRSFTTDVAIPGVAATDVIYFTLAGATTEMAGVHQFMTAAGTFLGISGTTWQLWSPPTAYGVGGALSFTHIQRAVSRAYKRGLGKKYKGCQVVVNPDAWTVLANDEAALRQYDASFTPDKFENGAENIKFYSAAGPVEIIAHDCQKEGNAFIHPPVKKCMVRVGSRPAPTFDIPGQPEKEKYLRTMENNMGVECRCYWNAALFSAMRSQFQLMNTIVNP